MSDGDDDPQLQSLRAVWLSLPDEDPPEQGLSQLMAAARVQAVQMAKPSRWARVIEMLRRPSVLALATVIVLIGGAVFIRQHQDKLETTPTASTGPEIMSQVERAPSAGGAPSAGSSGLLDEEQAEAPPAAEEKPAAQVVAPVAPPSESPAKGHRSPSPAKPTAPKPRPTDVRAVDPRGSPGQSKQGIVLGGATETTTPTGPIGRANGLSDKGDEAIATDRKLETKAPSPKPAKIATDDPMVQPTADTEDVSTKEAPKEPAITQLLAQCRSAATRGDCAAVRVIAQRIAKQNAAFYRDRVSKDATITKCFAAE